MTFDVGRYHELKMRKFTYLYMYWSTESLKPSILPRIQIQVSQIFLTLAKRGRQYFDQLEVKSY